MMDDRLHSAIVEGIKANAPRYFAVYGESRGEFFVDWGMEFADPPMAVSWSECGSHWESDSADGLVRVLSRIGEARLVWLTDPEPDLADRPDADHAGGR